MMGSSHLARRSAYFNELIRMEMLGSNLRFHYFSLKMAWVDVNSFCYILPVLLVSGSIFF